MGLEACMIQKSVRTDFLGRGWGSFWPSSIGFVPNFRFTKIAKMV